MRTGYQQARLVTRPSAALAACRHPLGEEAISPAAGGGRPHSRQQCQLAEQNRLTGIRSRQLAGRHHRHQPTSRILGMVFAKTMALRDLGHIIDCQNFSQLLNQFH